MNKSLFALAILISWSASTISIAQDSVLVSTIAQHTYDLRLENGRLAGSGAPIIREAIKNSQFLLVGEQHGIREVSTFTNALFVEARPEGFNYLCIETDPYMAAKIEALAKENVESLHAFIADYPMSIPFYETRDEFELVRQAVHGNTAPSPVVWGVDQVLMSAPRYLFATLAQQAPNEKAQQLALDYLSRAKAGFEQTMKTGDFSKMIMNALNADDYKKLHEAFDNHSASKKILDDIEKSQQIYGLWAKGQQYQNNRTRSLLMKKQFMDYYNAAANNGALPRVVFKFGSTHMYRGVSYYDQLDLGNTMSELAEMNGHHSVHFHVSGLQGMEQGPFGPPQPFDNTNALNPFIKKAIESRASDTDSWIVIDMRLLRSTLTHTQLQSLKDVVFGFDFWIYVPKAEPVQRP